jgi:hypothetical protein
MGAKTRIYHLLAKPVACYELCICCSAVEDGGVGVERALFMLEVVEKINA